MKIFVKAKPAAKETKVERLDKNHFLVAVKEPPVQGKANNAIIKALAAFFTISPSRIKIVKGPTSREKILEITSP